MLDKIKIAVCCMATMSVIGYAIFGFRWIADVAVSSSVVGLAMVIATNFRGRR